MKNRILLVIGFFVGIFLMNSCEEDPFDLFSDDPRDGLTGEWIVNEDSEIFDKKDFSGIYTVTIRKDPIDSTALLVRNFYELTTEVTLRMNNLSITIPDQTISGYSIEDGYGNIAPDFKKITLYYYVSFTGERDVVEAIYTRPE